MFDYLIKELPLEYSGDRDNDPVIDILNGDGNAGYELVSVVPHPKRKGFGLFYMKRKID